MSNQDTKKCIQCNKVKPLDDFYNLARSPDGKHRYCKNCCKVNRSRENVRRRDKKSKISNRQQYRAAIANIERDNDITLDEVYRRDKGICQLCGEYVMPKHASIDHIVPLDPKHGGTHTWDNVQLVHLKCNLVKGNRV